MVTTLSPNARETPTRPIPNCGKPAAITALPQPANVSQKVPMASAAYFFISMCRPLLSEFPDLVPAAAPPKARNHPNQGCTALFSPHLMAELGPKPRLAGGHPEFCLIHPRAQG